jgi:thiol-disulfide isomerase/thioredoxin
MQWQKYLLALGITAAIFVTAFYIASRIDAQRIENIRSIQDSISIDLLSSETQFELLGQLDCATIDKQPILSDELSDLAQRLSYTESKLTPDNPEVVQLKKQYSLLEIKDYLLMQQISQKCDAKPVYVLYFYSNSDDCTDCERAGEVLTYLHQLYPDLRVYSFDYNLDLSALQTLIALRKVKKDLPAFIINNRAPAYGFKDVDEMKALIPELKTLATSTAATTTPNR